MRSCKSWLPNIIVGVKRSCPDKKADKRVQLSFLMYSSHKGKCVPYFVFWMICSLRKWSLCLLFQPFSWIALVLQIQTACVLLAVWISHTSFSLESLLSYSVPRAWRLPLTGSTSPRLKIWNESTTFCSAIALTESSIGNQGIWKLLFQGGRRGGWGTDSHVRTTYPSWGTAFGAAWWNHVGEIHIQAYTLLESSSQVLAKHRA